MRWVLSGAIVLALMAGTSGGAQAALGAPSAPDPRPSRTCTDQAGPSFPTPKSFTYGRPGYHAALFARSGYPQLCVGSTGTAVIGLMNTGSLGWYGGKPRQGAFLGIPGDISSDLGDVALGWPRNNRPAAQATDYVAPGQVGWFTFKVRAPNVPGIYTLPLRPLVEGAQWLDDVSLAWTVTVKQSDEEIPTGATARTYYPAVNGGTKTIRVPSLMYHYVDWLPRAADRFRIDLTVSPTDFEEQLKWLRAQGYTTVTTSQLWWTLDQAAALPPKPIQLTFDDGYSSHYAYVLPLLQRYGFAGTFFVTANLVGRGGYMTVDQVRALADAGMDVQSHATDHFSMSALAPTAQEYQMCTARRILSAWTGTDVRHFAYPSGDFNGASFDALAKCGYLSAYKKAGGAVQSSGAMFTLQRSRVRGQQGLAALLTALRD